MNKQDKEMLGAICDAIEALDALRRQVDKTMDRVDDESYDDDVATGYFNHENDIYNVITFLEYQLENSKIYK